VKPRTKCKPDASDFSRQTATPSGQPPVDLREVGDLSLFISGFFADSFNRGYVAVDYYIQLGEYSYASLARSESALGDVFDELAGKFTACVDVLSEVSERSALT